MLSRYGIVVLDEAHERSLSTDVLFGIVKVRFVYASSHGCERSERGPGRRGGPGGNFQDEPQ
jgi:hypothetical protein